MTAVFGKEALLSKNKLAKLAKQRAEFKEVIADMNVSAKLTLWERNFAANMRNLLAAGQVYTKEDLTVAQKDAFDKIERKIYSVG